MERMEDFPAPLRPIRSTLRCFWRLERSEELIVAVEQLRVSLRRFTDSFVVVENPYVKRKDLDWPFPRNRRRRAARKATAGTVALI